MNKSMYVLFGGLFGGVSRYMVGLIEKNIFGYSDYSTLTVNLIGAFCLSTLSYYVIKKISIEKTSGWYIGLTTGFLGAFTSFSSLTKDLIVFSQESMTKGLIYLLISVLGGYIMVVLGSITANRIK